MNETFFTTAADKGVRLDAWLAGRIDGASRSKIQRWIKDGAVTVNKKKVTPHHALADGDAVHVEVDDAALTGEIRITPRKDVFFTVVHEDDDLVVIDKPSGLLVHPAVPTDDRTLVHGLLARWPDIAGIGEGPERPGIVHRLDRDASGLLVVARTKKAFAALKKAFQKHDIEKEYAVLVHGGPTDELGTIDFPIGRKSSGGMMAARPVPTPGAKEVDEADRAAVTHYEVKERFGAKATLLKVVTETGRTHQIRVHMLAIGCPVAGDTLYGKDDLGKLEVPRLFLHARRLAFKHPGTKKKVEFTSNLPDDLQAVIEKLRKK